MKPSATATATSPPVTSPRLTAIARPSPSARENRPTTATTATADSVVGSSPRPACSGENPRTSCRYWEKKNSVPMRANTAMNPANTEPAKAGRANSDTSISGTVRRRWRRTNSAPNASPAASAATPATSIPAVTVCLTAHTTGTIAAIDSSAETRSNGPGAGSRDSGSSHTPATISTTMIGTLIRNTEPQEKCSSSAPPTSGPTAAPPLAAAAQAATARARSAGSVNTVRISDNVEGISVAPATPSSSRATMSIAGLVDSAANSDAAPNAAAPTSSSRLRPTRSASDPMTTSSPARARE